MSVCYDLGSDAQQTTWKRLSKGLSDFLACRLSEKRVYNAFIGTQNPRKPGFGVVCEKQQFDLGLSSAARTYSMCVVSMP